MARRQALAAKYMSESEVEALFRAVKAGGSVRDWALFQVIYRRGLRATEASLLQLADYSIAEKRLFVHALKGSVLEEFWLTEIEAEAIDAWLAVRGMEPGPLFSSRKHGGAIQRAQIYRLMRRYCAAAGIPVAKAHPHALRHSCGTHVLRLVKDITAVQHWLRHKDVRSTQIYARFTRKEEIAEQFRGWGKKVA